MSTTKSSKSGAASNVGLGMIIGAAIGVTTGLFLQSKKGKELLKDAEKKASKLQAKLMKELPAIEKLTKEKYYDVVDKVTDYYVKAKEVTAKEAPAVKKILLKKWSAIEKQIKSMK